MMFPQPGFFSHQRAPKALQIGFTLIEVMVTVAIIAILSAIAIPIYSNYVLRSSVQNGVQGLAVARTRMEQYFMDNRRYNVTGTTCGGTMPTEDDASNFGFTCTADGTSYTVRATGDADENVAGFVYTINEQNVRTSTINKDGWGTGSTVNCWITRPGEDC